MTAAAHANPATGWQRRHSLLAYPYDWQQPVRTEQWVYAQWSRAEFHARFAQLLCFPWATLIDLLRRHQRAKAAPYLQALDHAPPRRTLIRATVCQHIEAKDLLPRWHSLRITDLYWSHATLTETDFDGIRVHPFPLYPVRCFDPADMAERDKPLAQRRYLYSFVGAATQSSDTSQTAPVRQWIFALPPDAQGCIIERAVWHYERQVYGEQIAGQRLADNERRDLAQAADEYTNIMRESCFCLCPAGTGPNSIRLWEALGFGCIPVLLADRLRLPGRPADWARAILRVPETQQAVLDIPRQLRTIATDPARLEAMRQAGRQLWRDYGEAGPLTILSELTQRDWIRARVQRHNHKLGRGDEP